jgi:hypothetical protein
VPFSALGPYVGGPSLDRFIIGRSSSKMTVYDFRTGKVGSTPPSNDFAMQPEPYNRLYPAIIKNGYLIVDLAAIP